MKIGDYVGNKDGSVKGRVIAIDKDVVTIGILYSKAEGKGKPIRDKWGNEISLCYDLQTGKESEFRSIEES